MIRTAASSVAISALRRRKIRQAMTERMSAAAAQMKYLGVITGVLMSKSVSRILLPRVRRSTTGVILSMMNS